MQYFDLAADVLAENAHLTYKFLSPVPLAILIITLLPLLLLVTQFEFSLLPQYMYEFLDALLTCQTAPEEVQSHCRHTTS